LQWRGDEPLRLFIPEYPTPSWPVPRRRSDARAWRRYAILTHRGVPSTLSFDELGQNGVDILSGAVPGAANGRSAPEIPTRSLEAAEHPRPVWMAENDGRAPGGGLLRQPARRIRRAGEAGTRAVSAPEERPAAAAA